jgi:GNAT superfamily N-acetyltransferase
MFMALFMEGIFSPGSFIRASLILYTIFSPENFTGMNEITTREATMQDLETLLQFEQGIIAAERPFDITLQKNNIRYYDIAAMIIKPEVKLVVAEADGQLVGCGYCRIEQSKPYLQHNLHGYLGFMYVLPLHRGKGINKLIVNALADWARSENVTELRLDVYYHNTTAVQAYEKAGFTKHMIEMRMAI